MNGILLLTMLTMPGQDTEWGFMKTPQGIEYIVQIEPQVIQSMVDGKEVYSMVPQEMQKVDIGRIRLHHGSGKLTEEDVSSNQSVQDVRYGYQPLINGGMEFIVQILPSGVRDFQSGIDVIVEIPRERTQAGSTATRPAIRDIRKFTVRIGTERLPQIPSRTNQPTTRPGAGDPAPAPPPSVTTTGPAPIIDPNQPNQPNQPPNSGQPPYNAGTYQPYTPPGTQPTTPYQPSAPGTYDPRYPDPRTTDPRVADPRTTDPRYTDPRYTDPRYTDPRYTGYTDPRYTDPRYTDPRYTDPRYPGLTGRDPYPTQPYDDPARRPATPRGEAPTTGPVPDPSPPVATTAPNPTTPTVTPARLPAAAEPAEKPYVPMLVTSLALIASLGGNLFLGWVAMGLYDRYRRALTDMRDQSRRVARA